MAQPLGVRIAARAALIAIVGMILTILICWYGTIQARVTTTNAIAQLLGHAIVSSQEDPDPSVVDPARFSFRGQTSRSARSPVPPVPTGWFGYTTDRYHPGSGWCCTQVILVKIAAAAPSTDARVAQRAILAPLGDFPAWSVAARPAVSEDDAFPYVAEYALGWPERAIMLRVHYNHTSSASETRGATTLGMVDRLSQPRSYNTGDETLFPVQPIAFGFLLNTLILGILGERLFAWIALPLFHIVAQPARRLVAGRRMKGGFCPKCGYAVSTIVGTTCPECGSLLNRETSSRPTQAT